MCPVMHRSRAELREFQEKIATFLGVCVIRLIVANPRPHRFEATLGFGYVDFDGNGLLR